MTGFPTSSAVALACVAALAACSDAPAPTASAPVTSAATTPPAPPATSAPAVPTPPPAAPVAGDGATTAKDSAAMDPKGTLSKDEETKSMPMAGHGNNHSSPSLEPAPKK